MIKRFPKLHMSVFDKPFNLISVSPAAVAPVKFLTRMHLERWSFFLMKWAQRFVNRSALRELNVRPDHFHDWIVILYALDLVAVVHHLDDLGLIIAEGGNSQTHLFRPFLFDRESVPLRAISPIRSHPSNR